MHRPSDDLQIKLEEQRKLVHDLRRRLRRLTEINRQRSEVLSKLGP